LAVNNFVATSNHWKSWYAARIVSVKISKEIVPFQQARVRIDSIGLPESDKRIRLRLFLGIRLNPKTSDSKTLVARPVLSRTENRLFTDC